MLALSWAHFKGMIDHGYSFFEEALSNPKRYVLSGVPRGLQSSCVVIETADITEYESGYQSLKAATYVDTMSGQNAHLADDATIPNGTYGASRVLVCHAANKVFNVENKHNANSLTFRVWGSPNQSNWEEIVQETTVEPESKVSVANNDYWKYIKFEARGNGGTSTIDAFAQVG